MSTVIDTARDTLIGGVILIALGLFISIAALLWNRRPLFRFFGLRPENTKLKIYLSRMEILPGGTIGVEELHGGYSGPSINIHEYRAALEIRELVSSRLISMLDWKGWLGGQITALADVQPLIDITLKRLDYNDITFTNIIIIGSSIYNLATEYYTKNQYTNDEPNPVSVYYFAKNLEGKRIIRARKGRYKNFDAIPCKAGRDLGIIERIIDRGNVVYICAGIELNVTCSAVHFLCKNWKRLEKAFRDKGNFALCLSFPHTTPNTGEISDPDNDFADVYPNII